MNDSTLVNPSAARVTLKLKGGARKSPVATKSPAAAHPQPNSKQKAGAHWSDEYKERMQAEMDALVR